MRREGTRKGIWKGIWKVPGRLTACHGLASAVGDVLEIAVSRHGVSAVENDRYGINEGIMIECRETIEDPRRCAGGAIRKAIKARIYTIGDHTEGDGLEHGV